MPAPTRVSDHGPTAVAPADVLPEARLLATQKQAWEGLYAAYAHFPPGAFTLPPSTGHLITLHLGHPVPTVRQRDGRRATGVKVHGDIEIVPSGAPSFWAYERANEALGIILESAFVQQVALQAAQRAPERLEFPHNFGTRDPFMEQLGLALYADLTTPGVGSRLFAESAAQLLAVHLLRKYATAHHAVREYTRGLSRATIRRVLEFIHAHLDTDLSLATLATTVGMSPYHFARLFKQSTGRSPHQYVIDRRITQAKHLLATTELPIAAIAYQVGFASQSHLAWHFRRRTGVTPKAYRDAR
jgi:AraC family transcriptional regulator